MLIDGKTLAEEIKSDVRADVEELKSKGITPKIVIVTVGPEGAWMTYVKQKIKFAKENDIDHELIHLETADSQKLVGIVESLNNDVKVHGIIIQRPVPEGVEREKIVQAINPKKDIDGFRDDSHFKSPIWLAILFILKKIRKDTNQVQSFENWIKEKTWVIVGKGETGGRPTIMELKKLGINPIVIDSKTENPSESMKQGDVIISGVGKRVVEGKNLKDGAVVMGIGIRREEDGKLYGDYDEDDIKTIAGYYTPTPGGVGPLNLSFLFKNLITAAQQKS